jgi:3-oxoacyl-[acyl-carrier protein] reductase
MAETSIFKGRFDGRVAFVTGAAQGLGRAVAARLAREGAKVVLADRNDETLAATVEAIRNEAPAATVRGEAFDVADSARVREAIDRTAVDLLGLDVLVNCAGILRDGWVDKMTDEDWNAVINVHLSGTFFCCRAAVPYMKKGGYGRIVNLSSIMWRGNPGQSNYSAAKAGLVGLTRTLALELVGFGVTANAVAPGFIDTPMTQSLQPKIRDFLVARQPGKRMGTPAEVAAAVTFLASEEASFVTGQVLHVCGGKGVGMGALP